MTVEWKLTEYLLKIAFRGALLYCRVARRDAVDHAAGGTMPEVPAPSEHSNLAVPEADASTPGDDESDPEDEDRFHKLSVNDAAACSFVHSCVVPKGCRIVVQGLSARTAVDEPGRVWDQFWGLGDAFFAGVVTGL